MNPVASDPGPIIGIALGGGGAKGWSHIGVIKALRDAGIVADVIAGTSMGAIVGGFELVDRLADLEEFALGLTPARIFSWMDLNLGGSGLILGDKLADRMKKELGSTTIEECDRPYFAITTELKTGHEIWLRRGSLVEAMRCSFALPGIFQPRNYRNRWLVDGALVNPVPVSACRAAGARFVIAVSMGMENNMTPPPMAHDEEELASAGMMSTFEATADIMRTLRRNLFGRTSGPPSMTNVLIDSFNITQDRIARSRLAGDPPDITIKPAIANIGMFEFQKSRLAIEEGYNATEAAIPEILSQLRWIGTL